LSDVFTVQDEIAAAITSALDVTLLAAAPRARAPNLEAYEHYLKARHNLDRWTPQSMALAQEHLERAIGLDPRFAAAHAEFAHYYHRLAIYGLMPPREALPLVRREAEQALALDPSSPEGHAMLGTVAAMFDYDWPEADRQFRVALAHEPVSPHIHRYYAHYCLLPTGRAEDAIRHHEINFHHDPLNFTARSERAICLRAASRIDEANDELRRVLAIDETFWFPYFILGVNLILDGRFEEAIELSEKAFRLVPWFQPVIALRAVVLARTGDATGAEALRAQMNATDRYLDPIGQAMFHLLSGDLDGTADWTERAIDERQPAVLFFLNSHAWALRSTPRWPAIARRMNLPA
jgi:tetratricopeptide (TPR) repeat protein